VIVRIASVVVIMALALTSQKCDSASNKPPTACEVTHEDYEVFSALLNGLGGPEDPEQAFAGKQILIASNTETPRDVDGISGKWGFRSKSTTAPSRDTVDDFHKKVNLSCSLERSLTTAQPYQFIADAELESLFKDRRRGWEAFYKKFPNAAGVWSFSLPGYNAQHTEALLSLSHSCGELCGTGHLYLLRKENGIWAVKNRLMLWIS
jgi:hypothetical protein